MLHVLDCLVKEAAVPAGATAVARYVENERAERLLEKLNLPEGASGPGPWRHDGVYLLSGGAGGLAREIVSAVSKGRALQFVLMGRREESAVAEELAELRRHATVHYFPADVSSEQDVRRVVELALTSCGRIDGVIHCAGATNDGPLLSKDWESFTRPLMPKVDGAAVLDRVLAATALDFFVVFSSLSGEMGNIGQASYGYANAALDAFALWRERLVTEGARKGKTLSIAWPLWDAGMRPDQDTVAMLRERFGIVPLEPKVGVELLGRLIETSETYVAVSTAPLPTASETGAGRSSVPALESRATFARDLQAEGGPLDEPDLDLAVVGMSGRYPGAQHLDQFWENLLAGEDSISVVPKERWDAEAIFDATPGTIGKTYSKWGGFVEAPESFDPLFFRISPQEAEIMDPQERQFLMTAWHAVEDAGYAPRRLQQQLFRDGSKSSVGVFVGTMWEEYELYGLNSWLTGETSGAGGGGASIANRVSFVLNLDGPSIPVNTMCSSSLMALHLASQSIRSGKCRAALVGGVNLSLHPLKYVKLSRMQMFSPEGRCKAFSNDADGYVPGEGVGCLLIRPLRDAIREGDRIRAVIRGSAANHSGTTTGMTVPSSQAQARVIQEALTDSRVEASSISYLEAHGTGTALGDPIEIEGIRLGLSLSDPGRTSRPALRLGSLKSNIGHLEAAAGIASLTKVILQLEHRALAPSLHCQELNSRVPWAALPIEVQRRAEPWNAPGDGEPASLPLRAGVSSFGAGGVNVHAILEEAPQRDPGKAASNAPRVVPLSAPTRRQLEGLLHATREHLQKLRARGETSAVAFRDFAYTLQTGREQSRCRVAFVAQNFEDLSMLLEKYDRGQVLPGEVLVGEVHSGRERPVRAQRLAFVETKSPRQAAQWIARLWVAGARLPWESLRGQEGACRAAVPLTPFQTRRYWVGGVKPGKPWFQHPSATVSLSWLEDDEPSQTGERESVVAPASKRAGARAEEISLKVVLNALETQLKVDLEDLDADEPFSNYGVDSVAALRVHSDLSQIFGDLPTGVLLDCRTARELARQIVAIKGDSVSSVLRYGKVPSGLFADDVSEPPALSRPDDAAKRSA